jgi:hypothetical protein
MPNLSPVGNWRVYRQGVVSNTLNPKVAIFFLALLPQFVDPAAGRGELGDYQDGQIRSDRAYRRCAISQISSV